MATAAKLVDREYPWRVAPCERDSQASNGVGQTPMDMERHTRVRQAEMPNEIAEGLGSLPSRNYASGVR
jgi:hypothetical protein